MWTRYCGAIGRRSPVRGWNPWRLPDLPDSALKHSLFGHAAGIWGLAFTSDGKLLATAGYEAVVRLWDLATWAELGSLSCTGRAQGVGFSPDGRLLVSGDYEGTVRLWDLKTLTENCRTARSHWRSTGGGRLRAGDRLTGGGQRPLHTGVHDKCPGHDAPTQG